MSETAPPVAKPLAAPAFRRDLPLVRLGYVALTDAAPLMVAAGLGLFARYGVAVDLVPTTSWSALRDRIAFGPTDAALLLGPMPLACHFGLGGVQVDLAVTAVAGRNGNTLVFGHGLLADCSDLAWPLTPAAMAAALATRRAAGRPRPVFAVVFPYSSHNYLLRHFLASGGIDPDHDVELIVLPPSALPEALAEGTIDGFCAGEPWGSRAVDLQVGRIVLSTSSIWPNHPEKLLAFRADGVARDPGPAVAVTAALIQATAWLADPANAGKAASILHRTALPGVPAAVIALALSERLVLGAGEMPTAVPGAIRFAAAATRPLPRHTGWLLDAMRRWGHIPAVGVIDPTRPDLWQKAASQAEFPDLPAFADTPPAA